MSETAGKGFFGRIVDDFTSARTYLRSSSRSRALGAEREQAEKDLAVAHEQIGAKATELNLGTDMPAFSAVQAARTRLADTKGVLREKEAAEQAASEALAADNQRHAQIVGQLEAEYKGLADAAASAKAALDDLQGRAAGYDKQIRKTQEIIDGAAQGKPVTEPVDSLKAKVANLESARLEAQNQVAPAQERFNQASASANAKADELKQARAAWNEAKSKEQAAVDSAAVARKQVSIDASAAELLLGPAYREFGRGLFESGQRPAELEPLAAMAQSSVDRIRQIEQDRAAAVVQAAATRDSAKRFAIMAGAALLGLIILIVVIVMLARGPAKPTPAPSPAPTPTTAPTTPHATPRPIIPPTTAPTTNPFGALPARQNLLLPLLLPTV